MKRSVAILGPTPPFVRWAIWHPCPIRELDEENLADQTFRQLRALRELSLGFNDERVVEGICLHPDASASDVDSAMGFSVEEIIGFFGTKAFVDDCCLTCPANSLAQLDPPTWVGCYGWLPTRDFVFAGARNALSDSFDLIAIVEQVLVANDGSLFKLGSTLFEMTTPAWFGFWNSKIPNAEQLKFLKDVFEGALAIARANGENESVLKLLVQFTSALRNCCDNGLAIHVEHVPAGNSDGQTWQINEHCPDCKVQLDKNVRQTCHVCGRVGTPAGGRKSRVLGLRPFVHLSGILGKEKTKEILEGR